MKPDLLPVLPANRNAKGSTLMRLVRPPGSELHALARRSRALVERWHDPRKIAGTIEADYEQALRRRGKCVAQAFP